MDDLMHYCLSRVLHQVESLVTLIMMGVPSLKIGVPSFYINFKFGKVVHPSVKGFEQALAVKQVSKNIQSFSYLNHLY